jgi:hypothetical protein
MAQSRASLIIGLALVALGGLFLAQEIFDWQLWDWIWPLLVVAIGSLFFVGMVAGGRSTGALAIPGSIITVIGLMLLVFNWLDRWEAWAYAWGLIVAAVGLGLMIFGWWSKQPALRSSGFSLMQVGIILFLIFGAFFELLIFQSFQAATWFWPVVLIGLGLWLLLTRSGLFDGLRSRGVSPPPSAEVTLEGTAHPVEK